MDVRVRLRGIERRFGSVRALDGAELELAAGEVHGVLGANGAGKSTLLNVLGGMLRPDAGTIEIDGAAVTLSSPRDAWAHGIGLVHQHFTLVPTLSVSENLALGMRDTLRGRSIDEAARAIMERTGLRIPLAGRVEDLGVGDRQRIEILKALLRDPRILVLDEPTAVLAPDEIDGLFSILRELAAEGRAVALVAHKLDEVLSVADRVTVLRAGRTVRTERTDQVEVETLVRAMIGDAVRDAIAIGHADVEATGAVESSGAVRSGRKPPGAAVARLEGVGVVQDGTRRLADVGLSVHGGEIVGVAGVEGNGQRELARVLSGRMRPTEGEVALPEGIGFIPQDRSTEGLIGDFDLVENVALAYHRRSSFGSGAWLRWDRLAEAAKEVRERFEVAAPSVGTTAGALSGGNQQRVVVGREIRMATHLLVCENPTRGLDVAAAAFVHDELRRLAREGIAVVLLSTDLDEVIGLSHRIFAIAGGRLSEVPQNARTREGIGALMLRSGAA